MFELLGSYIIMQLWIKNTDFLKAKSFALSKCSDWKFCTKTCNKNYFQNVKLVKNWSNCDNYMELVPVFLFLGSLFQNLRRFSSIWRNHVTTWLQLLETLWKYNNNHQSQSPMVNCDLYEIFLIFASRSLACIRV